VVGEGSSTLFGWAPWLEGDPLCARFMCLFFLADGRDTFFRLGCVCARARGGGGRRENEDERCWLRRKSE